MLLESTFAAVTARSAPLLVGYNAPPEADVTRFILSLSLLALLLTGCSSTTTTVDSPTVLQWALAGLTDLPTLDPALAADPASMTVASLVYGGLVRLDSRLRVVPDGASHWSLSRDHRTYLFSLRPNLRYPDGRHVTGADVAAALQRALGPTGSSGPASFYLSLIAAHGVHRAISAPNSHTVRITLVHPAAQFLSELALPASYVPDEARLTRYGATWTDHAAGYGPYYVQSWQHGRYLDLRPNPYYWGGRPHFHRIVIHFYAGTSGALAAYRKGTVSLVSGLQAGTVPQGHPLGLRRIPGLAMDYLAFNTTTPPFRHLNARRAFASLVSERADAQTMEPAAFPANSFLPPALGLTVPPWKPSAPAMTYLARAHYPGGQGIPPMTLIIPRDRRVKALANRLVYDWESHLHVQVGVKDLDAATYSALLNSRGFQVAIVRWGADYADPQDFLSTQLGPSGDNVTGWTSPAYTRSLNAAAVYAPSNPSRRVALRAAAMLAAGKVALVPLDEPAVTAVIAPTLRDVQLTPLGTIWGDWARARFTR